MAHGLVHLGFIDEPVDVLLPDDQIAHHHGRIEHVAAAHIEHPRDIIQHVEHMQLCAVLIHDLANRGDLVLHTLARILLVEDERLLLRHRRTIRTQIVKPVAGIAQQRAAARDRRAHILREFLADHAEINAQRVVFTQQPREIFFQRRRACRTHAHQGDAAAGDLLFRLNEVAAIDKQRRLFFADDQRARRAGEAGKPLTRLEMVGNIFRSMAVRRRHDDRGKVLILHPRPKRGDFFRNLHRKSLRLSVVCLLYTHTATAGKPFFFFFYVSKIARNRPLFVVYIFTDFS